MLYLDEDNFKTSNVLYNDMNIIFGAGQCGKDNLEIFKKYNIQISYFCDNDNKKSGQKIEGIEIINLNTLINLSKKTKINIIISSMYEDDIYEQLKSLNLNTRIYKELRWDLIDLNCEEDIKSMSNQQFTEYMNKVNLVSELLHDSASKYVYENKIKYLFTHDSDIADLIISKNIQQYFLKGFKEILNEKILVDIGAFTGDTIEEIVCNKKIEAKKILAFEVGDDNFTQLQKFVEDNGLEEKVEPIKKGVWSKCDLLYISKSGAGIQVTEVNDKLENMNSIEVVSLDEYLKNEIVDFIKMDIEGSELNALIGSQKLIVRSRPILSICIYHSMADHVDIPLYLKNILNDYTFILRHHYFRMAETVLYCIPNELYKKCMEEF